MMKNIKTLSEMSAFKHALFVEGDCGGGCRHKLHHLGFLPGEPLTVIQNTGHGAVTISLKGTRLAIGRGLAQKIFVKETE